MRKAPSPTICPTFLRGSELWCSFRNGQGTEVDALQVSSARVSCLCSVAGTVTEATVVRDCSGKTTKLTWSDILVNIWVANIKRPFLRCLFVCLQKARSTSKKNVGYPKFSICKNIFTASDCSILAILVSNRTALFCCLRIFVCFIYFYKRVPVVLS